MVAASKTALITGGAKGIGAVVVRRMLEAGHFVFILDTDHVAGRQLIAQHPNQAELHAIDVRSEDEWKRLAQHIADTRGQLDILVNCAAVIRAGDLAAFDLEDWRTIMTVNLDGVFLACKHCLPLLERSSAASIINFSSGIAQRPQAEQAAYGASKAAVQHFTKSLAIYCGRNRYNIRCNCIQPGAVNSAMLRRNIPAGLSERDFLSGVVARHPIGRLGTETEIADAVMYLVSEKASFITGTVFAVDGGVSI